MTIDSSIRLPVYAIFALLLTFVGDHYVEGVPSYALIFAAYVVARAILGPSVYRTEIIAIALTYLAFTVPIIFEMLAGKWPGYAFGYVQVALSISPFYVIGVMQRNRVVCVSARAALVLALCFLAVTLLLSMGFFAGSVSRTRFFFGPNVMYRIYGVVAFLLYFVAFRGRGWARVLAKGTILAALVLGCLATGSRGGLVTIVVVVVCIAYIEYFDRYDLKAVRLGLFTTIGAMLALLVVLVVRLGGFRSAKFNPGNSSEAIRLGNYAEFQDYLEQTDWLHLLMGTASGNGPYSFYPHNAVVESVVWGGALPTAVMLAAIAWLIGAFLTGPTKARFFAAVGIVILVGAQVSGSLLDNYAFVAVGLAGIVLSVRRKEAIPEAAGAVAR